MYRSGTPAPSEEVSGQLFRIENAIGRIRKRLRTNTATLEDVSRRVQHIQDLYRMWETDLQVEAKPLLRKVAACEGKLRDLHDTDGGLSITDRKSLGNLETLIRDKLSKLTAYTNEQYRRLEVAVARTTPYSASSAKTSGDGQDTAMLGEEYRTSIDAITRAIEQLCGDETEFKSTLDAHVKTLVSQLIQQKMTGEQAGANMENASNDELALWSQRFQSLSAVEKDMEGRIQQLEEQLESINVDSGGLVEQFHRDVDGIRIAIEEVRSAATEVGKK